jgi:hypothetical protein
LPASDPEFCAPANIAENFSKLFFHCRIDAAQALNCEKRGNPAVFMACPAGAACGNDALPEPWRRDRDMTIRQLLQIETIQFGKNSALLTFHAGKK